MLTKASLAPLQTCLPRWAEARFCLTLCSPILVLRSSILCLPEMKGRSIESMDDLFQWPLRMIYKHTYPTEEDTVRQDVQEMLRLDKLEGGVERKRRGNISVHVESSRD